MASLAENGITWSYTYDANGMRTGRTGAGKTYTYTYNGSQLVQMTVGSDTLRFTYDAAGTPLTVNYNGTTYYYTTNLQGDITGIVTETGATVITYSYDSWGKLLEIDGTLKLTLGELNPIRYRGYVYDNETALYYLQSRYYDPVVGRFINADVLVSTGQGLLGNNMLAYCRNNPVKRKDVSGTEDVCVSDVNEDNNPLNDLGNPTGSGGGGAGGKGAGSNGSGGRIYSAPPGGGGASSQIKVGNTTVEFGHGGRHMGGGDISEVESKDLGCL